MSVTIHRLVYYSRNRMGGSAETMAGIIEGIMAASRRNNAKVAVTGALMFNAGVFAQVLEGPCAAVEHTFERIQQDEHHGDVSLLGFSQASTRAFEQWSMAFVGGSIADTARYGALAGQSGYDPSRMSGEAVFETLQRLLHEEELMPT